MGTSTNYNAPTTPQWSKLKGKITRLTRDGTLSSTAIKGILQDFVRVNYNTSGGTARKRTAQNIARNIGGFFPLVNDIGFRTAFEETGLGSLEGKSLNEVTFLLLDHLCGSGSTLDETDARMALCDLMKEICDDVDSIEELEEAMEAQSDHNSLENLLIRYFGYYIFEQFCSRFYGQLDANIGAEQASERIDEIRRYIFEAVGYISIDQDISQIDWDGSQGQHIVEQIINETLGVLFGDED